MGLNRLARFDSFVRRFSCFFLVFAVFLSGCATKVLKYEKVAELKENKEFDKAVQIVIPEMPPPSEAKPGDKPEEKKPEKKPVKKLTPKKNVKHLPELEGQEGFVGRRPTVDPFRVGEKVVHNVRYLKMNAGTLAFEVRPAGEVNGKKSYQFYIGIKSSSLFSSLYSVDDFVTTLVDFDTLVPSVFTLTVKESGQLREQRAFFDPKKNLAQFWEKKVSSKSGEEQRKLEWEIQEYTQNVYSSLFYVRTFPWKMGSDHAFRVANESENLIFRAKAVRKERLSTDVGEFDTIVVKPEIELKGQFKPVGDIYMWLSDDDRKLILRIECVIKIGTLVSEVVQLDRGQD